MSNPTVAQVVVCALQLVFYWAICGPVLLVVLYKIWNRRYMQHVRKRYVEFVIVIIVSILVYVCISRAFRTLWYTEISNTDISNAVKPLYLVSSGLSFCGLLYAFIFRLWHLLFDIEWSLASTNKQWMRHIDGSSFEHDWWISKKDTFGNVKWTCIRVFCPLYLVSACIITVCLMIHDRRAFNVYQIFSFGIGLVSIVLICYIIWILPKFYDTFHIGREVKTCLFGGFILMLVNVFMPAFYDVEPYWIVAVSFNFILACIYVILALVIAYYCFNHEESDYSELSGASPRDRRSTYNIRLRHILSTMDTFVAFMNHLIKEFSTENLLASIEFIQFRNLYSEEFGIDLADSWEPFEFPLEDPSFPQSEIVFERRLQAHDKVMLLLEKYVLQGCEFEINISSKHRKELATLHTTPELLGKLDKKALVTIFDSSLKELKRLMADSYSRFVRKEEFKKCVGKLIQIDEESIRESLKD